MAEKKNLWAKTEDHSRWGCVRAKGEGGAKSRREKEFGTCPKEGCATRYRATPYISARERGDHTQKNRVFGKARKRHLAYHNITTTVGQERHRKNSAGGKKAIEGTLEEVIKGDARIGRLGKVRTIKKVEDGIFDVTVHLGHIFKTIEKQKGVGTPRVVVSKLYRETE